MPPHFLSSIILRALVNQIAQSGVKGAGIYNGKKIILEKKLTYEDKAWAEAMKKKHCSANNEQPVVIVTGRENARARDYMTRYGEVGVDISDEVTLAMRPQHAIEIRDFLKTMHHDRPESIVCTLPEGFLDIWGFLPWENGLPKCFKEWFALMQVWRLSMGAPENAFQDAAFGTPECPLGPLPKPWEDKLDECMQITNDSALDSAIVTPPKGRSLFVTRQDLNSVLPTWDSNPFFSGLLSSTIIERWFQILTSHQDQRKRGKTICVHLDDISLGNATPQELADRMLDVEPDIKLILFPTVIKERKHCILLAAIPEDHEMLLYDPLGVESTRKLQEKVTCIKDTREIEQKQPWGLTWMNCPEQREADACGVFMLVNAIFFGEGKSPRGLYSQKDALFLRRYIAAVICMGMFPD